MTGGARTIDDMSRRSSFRALPWLAVGGLLAGHTATSWLSGPHGTGPDLHGYLETVGRLGVVAAVLGLAALVTGRLATPGDAIPSTAALAGRLAALQVTAFVLMEIGERLVTGAPLADLASGLPVGMLRADGDRGRSGRRAPLVCCARATGSAPSSPSLPRRDGDAPISWAIAEAVTRVTSALGPAVGARAPPA